jgi:penicillin-binding protein 2
MAIGQGFVEVSPLQMTVVASTIANGGTTYRPRLISRIVASDGTVVRDESKPEVLHRLNMAPRDVEVVRRGMRDVVNEPEGTGKAAALDDQVVAGKTGTAQFATRYNGQAVKDQRTWFMSFAPFDKPRYAIVVMVEGGESGGKTCAPLVHNIYREIFDLEKFNRPYELTYQQPVRGHFGGVKSIDATAPPPARDGDDDGQDPQ